MEQPGPDDEARLSDGGELSRRIEQIEAGYEHLLAYAAQGRSDESGSDVRDTLSRMHAALDGLAALVTDAIQQRLGPLAGEAKGFVEAVAEDANKARGALGLVLGCPAISSLLVDNLNASIHLRALLTDLFLAEQALK